MSLLCKFSPLPFQVKQYQRVQFETMFSDESLYAKLQMHCRLKTEKPFSGLITNDAPSLPFRWGENV